MKTETIRDIEASIEKGYKLAEMNTFKFLLRNYWDIRHNNKNYRNSEDCVKYGIDGYSEGLQDGYYKAARTVFFELIWDNEIHPLNGMKAFCILVNAVGKEYGFLKEGE